MSSGGSWENLMHSDVIDNNDEPGSPALQADSLPSEPPGKAHVDNAVVIKHWGPD